jgi:hypothetical protein
MGLITAQRKLNKRMAKRNKNVWFPIAITPEVDKGIAAFNEVMYSKIPTTMLKKVRIGGKTTKKRTIKKGY